VSALRRFDRDLLAQPGRKYLVVLLGVNDLGHPGTVAPLSEVVSAHDLIAGHRQLIARAHEAGTLRPGIVLDDVVMLMCGVGAATRKAHACPDAWRRHMAILLDGLRADAATSTLQR
jgi:hypothetical protein